ncbi:MAG TPA: methyltransferase domain-containing protein [Casimicrobiaceae bacterium]|nr:methyltransferase domain-containing protein [Casimicrobiaceae bacterium]
MRSYGPLCTLFYDADKPLVRDDEVAWYAQRLPKDAGTQLELMCGSGRLLVPLVADGWKLHGVDASAAMLASCEARLAERRLAAPLFRQDLTQLNLPFRYSAAFVAAGSFQLITDPGAAALALQRIRAHLVDPGLLVMDMFVPSESSQRLGAPLVELQTVKLHDGTQIALRTESTMWADARMWRSQYRYAHRRGAKLLAEEHETLTLTWYSPEEIAAMVTEAGFRDVTTGASPRDGGDDRTFTVTAQV